MNSETSEAIAVFITAANGEEASRLAETLVGTHLAACVQVLRGMESIYMWKGNIERASEVLLIVKTARSKFAGLERQVRRLHSYQTPEIVALPIIEGSAPYLEWLTQSLEQ